MSLEDSLRQSIMANQQLTQVVSEKIGDIQASVNQAQQQVDSFIAGARAEFPFVNLLKNFRALDTDGDGVGNSPLGFWTYSSTQWSQQVIATADAPSFVQDLIGQAAYGGPDYFKTKANVIEVTLSQNGGTGFFNLLPGRYVHGRASAGAVTFAVSGGSINLYGHGVIDDGTGVINHVTRTTRSWSIDQLTGEVSGDNVKAYVFMPFVCAGHLPDNSAPLFLFDNDYYIAS